MRRGHIAIIGMAGKFPGADSLREFWDNLRQGRETITRFTEQELRQAGIAPEILQQPNYVRAKGALRDVDAFDAGFFSYPPRDARRMDPQIRLLHECSWAAFEDAGYVPDSCGASIGAYLGIGDNLEWVQRIIAGGTSYADNFDHFLLNYRDYAATRISCKLNLRGPSFTLLSACSTSLVAVHLACQGLRSGDCDLAIAGGASIMYPEISGYLYQEGMMLSSDGHCRPFDARADGTVFGDGAGVVVLKRLEAALNDRDHVYAVIRGSAVNNDGSDKPGFTTPSVSGQYEVIRAAQRSARVMPESISFVETHGTGTRAGDPVEFEALRRVFPSGNRKICVLGSVKSNIGHVNIAAGVAALIKAVLALQHREIPPTLHFESPNPAIDLAAGPFSINTRTLPWKPRGSPLRAGVSAFGFGGTNAHIIVEEAPRQRSPESAIPYHILTLSAKSPAALRTSEMRLAGYFSDNEDPRFEDAAFTLACGRKEFEYRRCVVARDAAAAITLLHNETAPNHAPLKNREVIFMFPGQGSQTLGMGTDLYEAEPTFRKTVDRSASILSRISGINLLDFIGPNHRTDADAQRAMMQTGIAQPAIFVYSAAVAELLIRRGLRPAGLIGHSLGEITAACISGALQLEDGIRLVARRGKLMGQLPPGSMLAVHLPEEEIRAFLNEEISLAAVNGPDLCVVSGKNATIKQLKALLHDHGIASQFLATSHAFHSSLMEPILEEFKSLGRPLHHAKPRIPMLSTVNGQWIDRANQLNMKYWAMNIRNTVRFGDGIRKIIGEKDAVLLDCGPGKTLSNLARMHMKRSDGMIPVVAASDVLGRENEIETLYRAIGAAWTLGASVGWDKFYSGEKRRRVSLPVYPFERRRFGGGPVQHRPESIDSWSQLKKNADMADWFYVPSWKRTSPPYLDTSDDSARSAWLLFCDACGVADRLREKLEANNQDVVTVIAGNAFAAVDSRRFAIDPSRHEDYENLFRELSGAGMLPRYILHLWSVTPLSEPCISWIEAERFQDRAFFSLLHLAQVLGMQNTSSEVQLTVISNCLHDVLGSEKIIPDKATILGPVKVISQEYPDIRCCSIDIDLPAGSPPERLIDQILSEAITNIGEPVVAYRGEHRWVQTFDRVRLDAALERHEWLRPGGVYLITGGLGGLGLVFAEFLAGCVRAKLILAGRTALPPRQEWDAWLGTHSTDDPSSSKIRAVHMLEKLGAEVMLLSADVTDRETMENGIHEALNRFGAIHGVIHAAGIHGEGIIQLKKVLTAKSILAPKINGTIILADLVKDLHPDFFMLCSSIASFLGGIGLVDYCAANSFMDSFVSASRHDDRTRLVSINWDMWGEVGMGLKTRMPEELQEWLEKELRDGITSSEGVSALQRIMTWNRSRNIIVSTRDLQARINLWVKREFIKQKESLLVAEDASPQYQRPDLSSVYLQPQTIVEQRIAGIWGKLFGIELIGRNDNFYELGGHSLLATTLAGRLKKEFSIRLSIRDILDHPVLSDLSAFIERAMEPSNE